MRAMVTLCGVFVFFLLSVAFFWISVAVVVYLIMSAIQGVLL